MILTLYIFISSIIFSSGEQTPQKTLIKEINKSSNSITTDRLGNLYLINDYRITMYNKLGDSLREFNSRKYGEITFVDATDPYQLLVFFQDYNLILFLDNFLSENGQPLDLQELGYDQISFACQSREKGVWLFDQLRQKIIKLDQNFVPTHESINLAQWFGKNVQPSFMAEFNNQLFIAEKNEGFYVFDHFATFSKRINLNQVEYPQVISGRINFIKGQKFCQYNLKSFETFCDSTIQTKVHDIRIEEGKTYINSGEKVQIFKLN